MDKKITTEMGCWTKNSPQGKGDGQKDQGSWTNCSLSKDSKALIRSIKDIISNNNKQDRGNTSFAVVAVKNLSGLLIQLEITGQARQFFQNSHLTLEQMMGWYLWASHQSWCKQPVAYTIQRVRQNESPPELYERFATLSWQEWQLYAVLHQLESPAELSEFSGLFEAWCERFDQTLVEQLPFGVGRGLEAVVVAIQAQLDGMNVGESHPAEATEQVDLESALVSEPNGRLTPSISPPSSQDRTVWQQTLQEVSHQMTKATFNAYLQGAELIGVEASPCEDDDGTGEGRNGRFVVQLRNRYAKEWVDNRLAPTILRTWSAIAGQTVQAFFTCDAKPI